MHKVQSRRVAGRGFLDFLRGNLRDFPVSDGGDGDENVLSGQLCLAGDQHVIGGLHINARHAGWCGQCGFAGDQCHMRARIDGGLSEGVAHFATRMIGDAAHWVNGFKGRASGEQNPFTRQYLRCE